MTIFIYLQKLYINNSLFINLFFMQKITSSNNEIL